MPRGFELVGFCKHNRPVWEPHPAYKLRGVLPSCSRLVSYEFLGHTYLQYTGCRRCKGLRPLSFGRNAVKSLSPSAQRRMALAFRMRRERGAKQNR